LGLALFVGQPGFHTLVLGQWALLLMGALTVVVLALRAGHVRRAGLAALAFLAKPQLFVWTAVGLALPAIRDVRYRRFVTYALVLAGALVLFAWLAYPDWFPAWLADIPARRTGRSAVLFSALGQVLGMPGRILAIAVVAGGVYLASRFVMASDAWLAAWLSLSSAGAIYSWSYDQVLLFVPLVIASGVLVANGRELAARNLALAGALTLLIVSPIFYAIGVARHDETFSIAVPVGFCGAILWALWPYRSGASASARASSPAVSASATASRQPRATRPRPTTPPSVSSSTPQTWSPSRARTSASMRSIRASASAAVAALSAMRTCTPSFFAYVATVGAVERTRSASSSSTAPSPIPSSFNVRRRSTPSRTIVGSTRSSHIGVISRGTPGIATIRLPSRRTSQPGAVPFGFGSACADGM